MTKAKTTLERAFEFARSGECRTVGEINTRLKAEGHMDLQHHLSAGRGLREQLLKLCKAARQDRAGAPDGDTQRA